MDYYRVLFSEEYSKKKGKYGIVDIENQEIDVSEFQDGRNLTQEMFNDLSLRFEGDAYKSLADYQMDYEAWRIISKKLYSVLVKFKNKFTEFYPLLVYKDTEAHQYYYLHFKEKIDVLDPESIKESFISPKVMKSKIPEEIDIFCYKDFDPGSFCISQNVKNELLKENITGMYFQKI